MEAAKLPPEDPTAALRYIATDGPPTEAGISIGENGVGPIDMDRIATGNADGRWHAVVNRLAYEASHFPQALHIPRAYAEMARHVLDGEYSRHEEACQDRAKRLVNKTMAELGFRFDKIPLSDHPDDAGHLVEVVHRPGDQRRDIAIVFRHGLGGGWEEYFDQFTSELRRFTLIGVNSPGTDKESAGVIGEHTPEEHRAATIRNTQAVRAMAMREYDVQEFAEVGHSHGANREAHRLNRLAELTGKPDPQDRVSIFITGTFAENVLVDSHFRMVPGLAEGLTEAIRRGARPSTSVDKALDKHVTRLPNPLPRILSRLRAEQAARILMAPILDKTLGMLDSDSYHACQRRIRMTPARQPAFHLLTLVEGKPLDAIGELDHHSVAIGAAADGLLRTGASKRIAELLNGGYIVLPTGHCPNMEEPNAVNAIIYHAVERPDYMRMKYHVAKDGK